MRINALVRSRAIWWASGLAFATLLLIMACVMSGFAIQRGVLPPIEVRINLGVVTLIAVETDDANCWRPIRGRAGPACSSASVYNPNHYYIGWVQRNTTARLTASERYRKVFVLRLPAS